MSRRNVMLLVALIGELLAFGGMAALGDLRAHVSAFVVLFIVAVSSFTCAFRLLADTPSLLGILLIAIGLRLPMLFTQPSLSDDVWRYLHDGRAQHAGMNPYAVAPADQRTHPFRGSEFGRINHPELITIYPPAAQISFAANALLGSRLIGWRVMLIAAELITMLVLARLLRHNRVGLRNLALYAWHPLAVVEVSGSAHLEPIGIALLTAGLLAAARNRALGAGALLGLSTGFKLVTAPLLLVSEQIRRPRLVAAAIVTLLIVYALYWHNGPQFGSLATFAVEWEGNASIYALLASLTDGYRARILAATLLLCAMVVIRRTHLRDEERMAACMLAILLLSPIVHPWYLLWLLAFVPVLTTRWLRSGVLLWSATVVFSYLPADLRLLEYAPLYALLVFYTLTAARPGSLRETLRPSTGRTQQIPT